MQLTIASWIHWSPGLSWRNGICRIVPSRYSLWLPFWPWKIIMHSYMKIILFRCDDVVHLILNFVQVYLMEKLCFTFKSYLLKIFIFIYFFIFIFYIHSLFSELTRWMSRKKLLLISLKIIILTSSINKVDMVSPDIAFVVLLGLFFLYINCIQF